MITESPLDLARRMLTVTLPRDAGCNLDAALKDCKTLAVVVVDRTEPVDIYCFTTIYKMGLCPCGQMVRWPDAAHSPKFCHECGKPIAWKAA